MTSLAAPGLFEFCSLSLSVISVKLKCKLWPDRWNCDLNSLCSVLELSMIVFVLILQNFAGEGFVIWLWWHSMASQIPKWKVSVYMCICWYCICRLASSLVLGISITCLLSDYFVGSISIWTFGCHVVGSLCMPLHLSTALFVCEMYVELKFFYCLSWTQSSCQTMQVCWRTEVDFALFTSGEAFKFLYTLSIYNRYTLSIYYLWGPSLLFPSL
jgi:hypothetical protein